MERQEPSKQVEILKSEEITYNSVFKCKFCVKDEDEKQYSLIPIQHVQKTDQKTNYPLSDSELTKQLKITAKQPSMREELKQEIEQYFKDLRSNIFSKLEKKEAQMVAKVCSISDFCSTSLYNAMSYNECLELKALSSRVKSKYEENKETERAEFHKTSVLQKVIDFDSPNSIKNLILKQIDQIDMFLIQDLANVSEQLIESKDQINIDQSITDLMKLVRNKFNSTSEDSCLKFNEQLNQIKFAFSDIQVPQVGPIYERIQSLTPVQTQVISKLIEDIASLNYGEEANEMKEPIQAGQIFELISNQANFCSVEYLEDLKSVIDHLGGVFGLFRTKKFNDRTDDQKAFNRIKISQLNHLAKLARKLNELTSEHSDKYLQCQTPKIDVQQNSTIIMNQIKIIDEMKEFKELENNNDLINVDQLLVSYPIFELLPFTLKQEKLLPIIFTKTNYKQSQQMGITSVGTCIQLMCPANIVAQCVSQELNKEASYSIKLIFNRPYGKTKLRGFIIGLIQNSQKDNEAVDPSFHAQFYSNTNGGNNMIIVRGNRLTSESIRETNNELEVRFCISKRQCFFSDSTYTNISRVREQDIDPNVDYRFGLCFYALVESDWLITVNDFKEIDPKYMNNFN